MKIGIKNFFKSTIIKQTNQKNNKKKKTMKKTPGSGIIRLQS
jgi:hypothetical protein